jgi:hypothetical protein
VGNASPAGCTSVLTRSPPLPKCHASGVGSSKCGPHCKRTLPIDDIPDWIHRANVEGVRFQLPSHTGLDDETLDIQKGTNVTANTDVPTDTYAQISRGLTGLLTGRAEYLQASYQLGSGLALCQTARSSASRSAASCRTSRITSGPMPPLTY